MNTPPIQNTSGNLEIQYATIKKQGIAFNVNKTITLLCIKNNTSHDWSIDISDFTPEELKVIKRLIEISNQKVC